MTKHVLRWPTSSSRSDAKARPASLVFRQEDLMAQLGHMGLGVSGIIPTLQAFSIDPAPMITAAGVGPSAFNDGASSIPCAALGQLLEMSAMSSLCPHFGLLVGARTTLSSL